MSYQSEFDLSDPTPADFEEVAALLRFLAEQGESWTTAKDIKEQTGIDDRRLRHLAAISGGLVVSGPGCPGYRHVSKCPLETVKEAAARLDAQASKMTKRASDLRRTAHRLLA